MTRRVLLYGPRERLEARYPDHVWCGEELVRVEPAPAETARPNDVDAAVAAVVADGDTAAARAALEAGTTALLGPHTVRALLEDAPDRLRRSASWACWLPTGLVPEVVAARAVLDEGALGRCTGGDLVTMVGLGPAAGPGWEADAACALDEFEAVLTGLDLLRSLGFAVDEADISLPAQSPDGLALMYRLTGGGVVRHLVVGADGYAVPGFRAELRLAEGRLLLRHEMAPGALLLWDRQRRAFTSPALPKLKPNVQAPDTARGGAETAQQLAGLLSGDAGSLVRNDVALDLVARAASLARSGRERSD